MNHILLPRLFFIFVFSTITCNLAAQWTLKHASSVILGAYLPCHSVINNNVYLVGTPDNTNNYVYEYNPAANTYTQKALTTIAGFNDQVSFTLNNQMYLVGFGGSQDSYAYDPPSDAWIPRDNTNSLSATLAGLYSPSAYGLVFNGSLFAFSLNNKAYIGGLTVLDLSTMTQSMSPYVFVYDPATDSYTVLTVPDIMAYYNILTPATFELNGKGYVMGTMSDPMTPGGSPGVYEFDPSVNSFTSKAACACGTMGYSSFVLNNVAYVNVIENCSARSPVYVFDPLANTWTPSDTIFLPDTADLRLGFAVNGKGYLGYGRTYNNLCGINGAHSQLYEYAPETAAVAAQADRPTGITVFPNPAENRITFRLNFPAEENMLVILTDVTGKEAGRWTVEKGESELAVDASAFADGMYFLRTADGKLSGKVVVGK